MEKIMYVLRLWLLCSLVKNKKKTFEIPNKRAAKILFIWLNNNWSINNYTMIM